MEVITPPKRRKKSPKHPKTDKPDTNLPFWRMLLMLAIGVYGLVNVLEKPFIDYDESGKPKLADWRQRKLDKELDDMESAEQYVLIAKRSDWFPCYACPNSEQIYLDLGEVWRYGVTTKGQIGRYGLALPHPNLRYRIQFEGTLQECLRQERIKIYHYALLPENLKRPIPLIRPPGNKQDS